MKKLSCAMLILVVIPVVAAFRPTGESQTSAQVTAGDDRELEARVDGTVREAGTLESAETLELQCLIPGGATILSLVPDGTQVRQGDLLVELDSSLIQQQIQQQKIAALLADAERERAETRLERLAREEEFAIDAGKAELELAKSAQQSATADDGEFSLEIGAHEKQLALLEAKIALVKKQQSNRVESAREAFDYRLMLLEFNTQAEIAREKLKHLKTHTLPLRQAELEQQVLSAEHHLKLRKMEFEETGNQAGAELAAKEITAKAEQTRLEELNQQLESCRIVAPRDGIVVHAQTAARRATADPLEAGTTVRERQTLVLMPDLKNLQMNVRVHESKIARVKKSQIARIRFDALPGRTFRGAVISVADTPRPGTWPNTDIKEYEVLITLLQSDPRLKLGMSGVAEIDVTK